MEASTSTLVLTRPAMDPSSLRALALSTRRSKRRKPAVETTVTSPLVRPLPVSDSMQLDYGQDDVDMDASEELRKGVNDASRLDNVAPDDVIMREEGEISDVEEEAPSTLPLKQSTTPVFAMNLGKPLGGVTRAKPLLDRISSVPPVAAVLSSTRQIRSESPNPSVSNVMQISEEQVRPNIYLTQAEYDKAKDIILDLLGWGVSPEYLVESGLTREIVFYVFRELNLQLPSNLDTTGLVPYTPDTMQQFKMFEHTYPSDTIASSTASPSPMVQTPPDKEFTPVSVEQPPVRTPTQQESLNDMERQRRQELIARKAVQASRGAKEQKPRKPTLPMPPPSASMVDDFLNSITPQESGTLSAATTPDSSQMTSILPPTTTSPSVMHQAAPSPILPPPSSSDSMTSTFNKAMRIAPERIDHGRVDAVWPPARRIAKRPVASDFVDFDGHPKPTERSDSSTQSTTTTLRRKTGASSFVNVRQTTKFVIDLSDSESESEDESQVRHNSSIPSPVHANNKLGLPSLEETEREIQRMRDLIAQREKKAFLKKSLKATATSQNQEMATPAVEDVVMTPANTVMTPPPLPGTSTVETPLDSAIDMSTSVSVVQDHSLPDTYEGATLKLGEKSVDGFTVNSPSTQEEAALSITPEQQDSATDNPETNFQSYSSMFASYPSLRLTLASLSQADANHTAAPFGSGDVHRSCSFEEFTSSSEQSLTSELNSLRETILTKSLDPNKKICQFEIPGDGVCRDANCDDVHPSRLRQLDLDELDGTSSWLSARSKHLPVRSHPCVLHGGLPFN
ncbi:hypothetical protein FA15DRAFT_665850 [Coprinopsis marcescibilis]|uniref:Zinc-finger domain-containing protein n=1 Tax=Coprinopsis marcescibilis TaxID=230819 RepID=A0A5C3L5J5_COPMA|nr:hypothetical protein FA15DRAFT_665850 [Coprinopsis marcescibilis]